jgi:hypothetical protein
LLSCQDSPIDQPVTPSTRYYGSKYKLLDWIWSRIAGLDLAAGPPDRAVKEYEETRRRNPRLLVSIEVLAFYPDSAPIVADSLELSRRWGSLKVKEFSIFLLALESAMISVFGPHFRERPMISGSMFNALGAAGISVLAISTSISSCSSPLG